MSCPTMCFPVFQGDMSRTLQMYKNEMNLTNLFLQNVFDSCKLAREIIFMVAAL